MNGTLWSTKMLANQIGELKRSRYTIDHDHSQTLGNQTQLYVLDEIQNLITKGENKIESFFHRFKHQIKGGSDTKCKKFQGEMIKQNVHEK